MGILPGYISIIIYARRTNKIIFIYRAVTKNAAYKGGVKHITRRAKNALLHCVIALPQNNLRKFKRCSPLNQSIAFCRKKRSSALSPFTKKLWSRQTAFKLLISNAPLSSTVSLSQRNVIVKQFMLLYAKNLYKSKKNAEIRVFLSCVERIINSLLCHKLLVVAALDDLTLVHYHYAVAVSYRGESVRDDEDSPVFHKVIHTLLH